MKTKTLSLTWNNRLRRTLNTPLRPGISRDIVLVFITLGIIGLFAAKAAEYELHRQEQYGSLLNATGHLRMLSQRINLTAQRVVQSDTAARELLPKLNARFAEELLFVEQTGLNQGIFLKGSDAEILLRLKDEWQQTRAAAEAMLSMAPSSREAQEQLQLIDRHSAALLPLFCRRARTAALPGAGGRPVWSGHRRRALPVHPSATLQATQGNHRNVASLRQRRSGCTGQLYSRR